MCMQSEMKAKVLLSKVRFNYIRRNFAPIRKKFQKKNELQRKINNI